ncbi:MAG: hypothetical protein IPN71_03805 [Fibrobacteres bacterium]|nr:hypothetical protein [Fibrobacterota bacterium]
MSLTFKVDTKVIGTIPVGAFDGIMGFDNLLENKTGKFLDLYGKTILYKTDVLMLIEGIDNLSIKTGKSLRHNPSIKHLIELLSSIGDSDVLHVFGE